MDREVAEQLQELHARICKAIADPKRLMIINELRDRELRVSDLCDALGFSQSNASQHLAILRERGVVASHRVGTHVYYSLRSQKVVMAVDLLREFLVDDLAEHGRLGSALRDRPLADGEQASARGRRGQEIRSDLPDQLSSDAGPGGTSSPAGSSSKTVLP